MKGLGFLVLKHFIQVCVILIYLIPTMVASRYRHSRHTEILFLNILLGWTVVGWVIAFRWASTPEARPRSMRGS
jgi:hypothetical protein